MPPVMLKNFPSRIFAEQAQQLLAAESIPSMIKSPDIGMLASPGSNIPQGADLYVPEEDLERAREIVLTFFDHI